MGRSSSLRDETSTGAFALGDVFSPPSPALLPRLNSDWAYSVVIPTFNGAATVRRAIASAIGQSVEPAEIIVVDDASTDGTAAVLAGIADSRLTIIRHTRNRGPSAARNAGARAASTSWIAFLDSDDEWLLTKMERQLQFLLAPGSRREGCVTGYCVIDRRNAASVIFLPKPRDLSFRGMLAGCRLSLGSTLVVARRLFLARGKLDERLRRLEDWDWALRYLQRHSLEAIPEPLTVIYKSQNPAPVAVQRALARLRASHRGRVYGRSYWAGRKFDSGLLVEEAAGAFHQGRPAAAALLTVRALWSYPLQGLSFYATLGRRSGRVLTRAVHGTAARR